MIRGCDFRTLARQAPLARSVEQRIENPRVGEGPTLFREAYLAQLSDATPAVAHVEVHAKIVLEKWRMRQPITTCQRLAAEGFDDVGTFLPGCRRWKLASTKLHAWPYRRTRRACWAKQRTTPPLMRWCSGGAAA
jgi:hypothetical protein